MKKIRGSALAHVKQPKKSRSIDEEFSLFPPSCALAGEKGHFLRSGL